MFGLGPYLGIGLLVEGLPLLKTLREKKKKPLCVQQADFDLKFVLQAIFPHPIQVVWSSFLLTSPPSALYTLHSISSHGHLSGQPHGAAHRRTHEALSKFLRTPCYTSRSRKHDYDRSNQDIQVRPASPEAAPSDRSQQWNTIDRILNM